MTRLLVSTVLAVCLCCPAFSTTISYSAKGAFPSSGTPVTAYSMNGTTFEFNFSLPEMPTPYISSPSAYFSISVPVAYKLGATAFALQTIFVYFDQSPFAGVQISSYPSPDIGVDAVSYIFNGTQLFTGITSAPTLVAGNFATPNATIQVNTAANIGYAFFVPSTLTATAVPEPASFGLASLVLAGGAIIRLRRSPCRCSAA